MYQLKMSFWNVVPHGFICLVYKSLTFQAQGIRAIPRFQADQSSTGLAFKSGEWWACKAIDAIANQTDSSNSPEENAWWVSRWAQTFQNSAEETQESFSGNALCTMIATVSQLLQNPSLLFHEGWHGSVTLGKRASSRLFESFWNVWYFCEICFRFLICKVWNCETIWNSWMNYSNVSRPRYATWFIE